MAMPRAQGVAPFRGRASELELRGHALGAGAPARLGEVMRVTVHRRVVGTCSGEGEHISVARRWGLGKLNRRRSDVIICAGAPSLPNNAVGSREIQMRTTTRL